MKTRILVSIVLLGMMSCAHIEKPAKEPQVTVQGAYLSAPGAYSLAPDTTLSDILRTAGISKEFLGPSGAGPVIKIRVTRRLREGDSKEVFNANFSTIQSRRCSTFLLEDGDLIDVRLTM